VALITDRDLDLLRFIAAHRFVFAAHAKVFLDVSPSVTFGRLRALERRELLCRDRLFHELPAHFQITRAGLHVIGSDLPRPRIDTHEYQHDIGVAWLWLAARGRSFGEVAQLIAERELRSSDGKRDPGPHRWRCAWAATARAVESGCIIQTCSWSVPMGAGQRSSSS
jgi:hypothetical protein